MALPSIFEIADPSGSAESAPALFGLWQSALPSLAVSFAAGSPPTAPTWRVHLSGEWQTATAQLDAAKQRLQQTHSALDNVPERLTTLVTTRSSDLSFSTTPLAQPETALLRMIDELEGSPADISFGIGGDLRQHWDELHQQYRAFIARIDQTILHAAWVETDLDGQLIGRTALAWDGDGGTIWRRELSREQIELHQRSLALAIESRATLLRMLGLVMRGAALLATTLATPGGLVMALPAAWKFVNDVIAEIKQ